RGVCVQFGIGHGRPRRAGPARAARHRRDLRAPRPRRTIGQDAFEVRPLRQPAVPAHRTPPDRGAPPHTGIEHQFDTDRLAPLTDSPPSRDDEGGLMAWDMAVVSAFVRAARKPTYPAAARFRAHLEAPKPDGAPPLRLRRRHRVQIREIDGFRCVTVTPRGGAADGPVVLYLHGGAYVSPIARQHWALISRLAGAGAAVHVPLYGRAPQHTYRETYRLLDAVYADLAPHADRLTVMGDSAGGGLALGLAQVLRDTGRQMPRALTLIAPWVDVTCSNPGIAAIAPHDPWLSTVGATIAGQAWA